MSIKFCYKITKQIFDISKNAEYISVISFSLTIVYININFQTAPYIYKGAATYVATYFAPEKGVKKETYQIEIFGVEVERTFCIRKELLSLITSKLRLFRKLT